MSRRSSRFQTQTPWTPLRYSPVHETIWQFLCTASLVFGAWYIGWRWIASINFDALWFAIPLLIAETGSFIGLALFTVNLWSAKSPVPGALPASIRDCTDGADMPDRPLSVDVFFATYSEDPELVRLGLRDAKALTYPHPINLQIHVLDDGKRPAMEAVAREEGVNYITRSDNVGFKAGNLRNAMTSTSGDFILICDADMRPFPTFLEETLGYFRDPKVAWVQTPQWFYDVPPGVPLPAALGKWLGAFGKGIGQAFERVFGPVQIGEDPFANDPQLFFDVILRRRNWANASFCCGAGSIHRREAVMEAALRQWSDQVAVAAGRNEKAARKLTGEEALSGSVSDAMRWQSALEEEFQPYKFHVSEDIYTSIVLHSDRERGWKSVLHPVVQAKMLSPNDLLSWTIQRFKYAGGTLDILAHDNPLLRKGLTLPQKLMYGSTFYSYLAPLWNIVFLFSPIVFLFSGIAPVAGYSLDFFVHIAPFLLFNELSQLVAMWGNSNSKGRAWYLAMFPLNLQALWAVVRGRKISFPVTPKDRQVGFYPRLVRWQIGLVVLTMAGLTWGWVAFVLGREGYTLGAMIANTLWGTSNALSMVPMIRAAFWQPDPVHEAAIVEGPLPSR
ncbi:glycosyltransferase family 2 protein [Microvirga pakistanensis]|uniref:glycosyltransferase family 2 protein n=1 Tax=Microvirga pakistanensis TaxID=1682650 RepID=UPI00106C86CA|nr:cellulose synthase catalytic subunit [Microvirga pakistanensis]